MPITFVQVKKYLNAIAANGNLDPTDSGHGIFWNVDYPSFMNGTVPNKRCASSAVSIVDHANPTASAFYQILQAGWCTAPAMPQMPRSGPFVTDAGYSVAVDGAQVSGAQILQDIGAWLAAGAPENG
jgi:hypothetical protein